MKPFPLVFAAATLAATRLAAGDYYVAPGGADTNPGSLDSPFATIQRAVDQAAGEGGGTVHIREGTYRERIDLSGKAGAPDNPLILTGYNGEPVRLDGTLPVTSAWTLDEGNIYRTTVTDAVTQLFVDGKLMTLARFPNALVYSDLMWDRHAARRSKRAEGSTNGHVVDDPNTGAEQTLAGAGVSFDGCIALLNFGNYSTSARVVSGHVAGSAEFDYSPAVDQYRISKAYFFEGGVGNAERVMLDMPEEWAFDESTNTLYLWADDGLDPAGRNVAGKVQDYAVVGDPDTRHIVIDGLDFFATTFFFEKSDNITIRNCRFDYYASSKRALGDTRAALTAQFTGRPRDLCQNITVYNCEFRYADGTGLLADYVENMLIENNLFYQIDYACANTDSNTQTYTLDLRQMLDLVYRRNTIAVSGSAQSFRGSRRLTLPVQPIVCEFNYHTACGLQQTDGASMYIPAESIVESVARYNWFIGNGARDFRWDGDNTPVVTGRDANLYRNVAMATPLKTETIIGDGYRLKGDFHEVYHNIGVNDKSSLNVALDLGGNANSVSRNNAADLLTADPIPGSASHNFIGQYEPKTLRELLRDPDNWDFRPRADAAELIDQGTPVNCLVNGVSFDVTAGYNGSAPDIGAYEFGDTSYWIPGRILPEASMPVPPSGGRNVKLDADLMWLGGMGATSYDVYLGTDPGDLAFMGSQTNNIYTPGALAPNTVYYWRIDSVTPQGTVAGPVWSAATIRVDAQLSLTMAGFDAGHPVLRLDGPAGATYTIQAAADLQSWTEVDSFAIPEPPLQWTDPEALTEAPRFYRVLSQP